ncbi:MAG: glycoside hydrolase family 1 protein [Patescibacteria group bacterium]
MKFPQDFTWGTATAAHQIEGNNKNSDWWEWENNKKENQKYPLEPSGIACDSYNRYEEDFDLCAELGNNAVRISVEWARIEPDEGVFSDEELAHYRDVLKAAKKRGLKTFVTLHHFTNPIWFAKRGGWESLRSSFFFARYAKKCAEKLGDLIDVFYTINEPQVYALMSFTIGTWPPQKRNYLSSLIVQLNMISAHNRAYRAIKSVKNYPVGIVKNIVWYETYERSWPWDKLGAKLLFFLNCDFFLAPLIRNCDVLGINYYFTNKIKNLRFQNPPGLVSNLNWWINPDGLKRILLHLKKYKKPIYITENGLADSEDKIRKIFIKSMLIACVEAMESGAQLEGYFHWSIIDNFEWHEGFWPRFGLVAIKRKDNLKRVPRKSFYYYQQICNNNSIGSDL